MTIGIRRNGGVAIEFASWFGDTSPPAGSLVELDDGDKAMVVIVSNQFLALVPGTTCQIVKCLEPNGETPAEFSSLEAQKFDALVHSFPVLGSELESPSGKGIVVSRDLRHGTIDLQLHDSSEIETLPVETQG